MTQPRVELIGADAAMADLKGWAKELAPEVAKASSTLGQRVADLVSGRVPHLTGQLAGSLDYTELSEGDEVGAEVGYDGSVPYDGWIEFGGGHGRSYQSDGRYLYPTAAEHADEWMTTAADVADDTAKRYSWSTPTA